MDCNPLWDFSVNVYNKPQVATALLELQEVAGTDTNMLLSLAWMASQQKTLTDSLISSLHSISINCQRQVIIPLRSLRCRLKELDGEGTRALYDKTKELELQAEHWQQDLLYQKLEAVDISDSNLPPLELARQYCWLYCNYLPNTSWEVLSVSIDELMDNIGL